MCSFFRELIRAGEAFRDRKRAIGYSDGSRAVALQGMINGLRLLRGKERLTQLEGTNSELER
jgi:hypothetical protein